jgi:hypothetical protein
MTQQRRRLDQTVAALETRYGAGVVRSAHDLTRRPPPHLSTGFPQLDALTGCGGIPLRNMSILSGRATSGKLTLAYKLLVSGQHTRQRQTTALVDLAHSADPDYLARAGVDLARLLLVRPRLDRQAVDVLVDLVLSRQLRVVVVNGLAELQRDPKLYRYLNATLGRLQQALRTHHCALVWVDDPAPAWLRWFHLDRSGAVRQYAALHLELQWERWLTQPDGQLYGYAAQARLLKSRWARPGRTAPVEIVFNGVIQARPTW